MGFKQFTLVGLIIWVFGFVGLVILQTVFGISYTLTEDLSFSFFIALGVNCHQFYCHHKHKSMTTNISQK